MITMGQAVDAAVREHDRRCERGVYEGADPAGSAVYQAEIKRLTDPLTVRKGWVYRVEMRAEHFSAPILYYVDGNGNARLRG